MIKKKSLALLIYTLYFEINKVLYHSKVLSILYKAVHFANMFETNLIWFNLCLVAVPQLQIAWSAQVNTTALDRKVIISGDHNEVIVSTDRA